MNTNPSPQRQGVWRMHAGIALFWVAVLGLLYWGMERYLQPQAAVVTSSGSVQLQRHRDGHFYAYGSINGQPVRFVVDTGATYIAVTDALAQRADLQGGEAVQFHTANGTRPGRLVRAARVTLGPLEVGNLTIGTGYTGKTDHDALLGQNFLRQFDMVMREDVLELRAR